MTAILFLTFLVLLVLGVPIAFAIAVAGAAVLLAGDVNLLIVVQRMFASTDSFPLVAVPFFILAGDLLARGAMSQTLVSFAESLLGRIRGGLSAVATTAAVGATLIPELKKRGYDESSSAALVAASGCIGVVIPPSVPMVLYAVIAGPSVTQLFSNGFLPGIAMGVVLIAIALYQAHKRHYPRGEKRSPKDTLVNILKTFARAIGAILMPLIILGGIFSGKFTPSESAAVAVIYAALISFVIYRDMSLKELGQIILGSARTSSVIMIIIACSGIFGWALANWKIPEHIATGVLSISDNKYVLLLLIALIVLVAGVFMETSSAVILLTPVFLPLVNALGVSLVHFGIIFTIGISIGMITPPVAINLFVASSTTGLPIEKISKSVVPYLVGLILVFLLYTYLPLFIPALVV